jgi:two-component system, NarL family, nitrate/nitrite response regulator NarL
MMTLGDADGTVRLMVVDPHPVVRLGLAAAVALEAGMVVVAEASTAAAAVALALDIGPDVILLDYRLPDMLAPEALALFRAAVPEAGVVVFTAERNPAAVVAVLAAGFDGVLFKDTPVGALLAALRRVAAGEAAFDDRLPAGRPAGPRPRGESPLTRREHEVLRRVAMGETNREIAEAIGLSSNTVKSYLQTMLGKLGARNRVEALARAGEAGLI